jgi:hypothetical protein
LAALGCTRTYGFIRTLLTLPPCVSLFSVSLWQTTVAVCGPVTAEAASRLGIPVAIMPPEYTLDAFVDAITATIVAVITHVSYRDTETQGTHREGLGSVGMHPHVWVHPNAANPASVCLPVLRVSVVDVRPGHRLAGASSVGG